MSGKDVEIIITKIKYNDNGMKELANKYFSGKGIVNKIAMFCTDEFLIKRKLLGLIRVLSQLVIKIAPIKTGDIEVKNYFKNCEINHMGLNMGLELKFELKNIDITKLINEQALPKTHDNVFIYELLKLINEELDENVKTNWLELLFKILNEKRIIPKYIKKISREIEDLSGLDIEMDEIKVKINN